MRGLLSLLAVLALAGCSDYQEASFSTESGDLDCADVSYSEAQDLIADGDPHGLDRDGDGEACETNAPGY